MIAQASPDLAGSAAAPPAGYGSGSAAAAEGRLPCLSCNNCTKNTKDEEDENSLERLHTFTGGHKRSAHRLYAAVDWACEKFGISKIGFMTLSFPEPEPTYKVALKRFHSLSTHVLKKLFLEHIRVVEWGDKKGRIHFHLVVVCPEDIQTGFNFEEVKKRNYRSASPYLKKTWKYLRENLPKYGFGRSELQPVKSTKEAIARYVGGYISKHINSRQPEHKGIRLVGMTKGMLGGSSRFGWVASTDYRRGLKRFCEMNKITWEDLPHLFGRRWSWNLRIILDEVIRINRDADRGIICTDTMYVIIKHRRWYVARKDFLFEAPFDLRVAESQVLGP